MPSSRYYLSDMQDFQQTQNTMVPKTNRTIETIIDNTPWAPVTPYLTYSESQAVQAQEEITAIFSELQKQSIHVCYCTTY